jgi:uncharacterized protein
MVLGDPVSGRDFFDRNREMGILFSTLEEFKNKEKRNIALIGIRKIGKTSIIKEFIRRLNKSKPDIVCLDIYLPEQSPQNFFRNCIGAILLELMRSIKFNVKSTITIEEAMKIVENDFPRSSIGIRNMINYLSNNNFDEAFNYLFQLFDVIKEETKNCVIVFLDEFQRLQEYSISIKSPLDKFREKVMNQNEILYIISGSAVGMLNRLISSTNSPLYGHFESLTVRGFEFKDAYEFIVKKKAEKFPIGDTHISFLYEVTNGNPFYLDILIHRLKRYCKFNKLSRINDNAIEEVLINEVFKAEGSIYAYFSLLLEQSLEKSGSSYYTEILKSIALGKRRPSQISKNIGIPMTTISPYLRRLQELELIGRSDLTKKNSRVAEYEILDSLFELWLKYVYSVRQNPLLKDISIKIKVFKDNISKILQDYNSEIGRGNESRIRELFRAFDNDELMGLTIPKFDSVERVDVNNEEIDLFCKTEEEIWVAEISKTKIDKAEIDKVKAKLNNLPKEDKDKIKEVIIIPLKDITENAINFAKEQKYHIWTLQEINRLLKRKSMFRILI